MKTSLRFCLTPVRMAAVKKTKDNKDQQVCGGKANPYSLLGVVKHYKSQCIDFSRRNLKIKLYYDPDIPVAAIYPKNVTLHSSDTFIFIFIALSL